MIFWEEEHLAEGTAFAKVCWRHSEEIKDCGVYSELDVKLSKNFEQMLDIIKCNFLEWYSGSHLGHGCEHRVNKEPSENKAYSQDGDFCFSVE